MITVRNWCSRENSPCLDSRNFFRFSSQFFLELKESFLHVPKNVGMRNVCKEWILITFYV